MIVELLPSKVIKATKCSLQIFEKVNHNTGISVLHPIPEARVVEYLLVAPNLVHGDLSEVLTSVQRKRHCFL